MKRRRFLHAALATSVVSPLALMAADAPPAAARRGFRLPVGHDRHDQPMRLGGITPTNTKISTADSGGSIYLFEHRHMGRNGPPRHFHHAQDEFFFVIEGQFRFEVGDEKFSLGPGDTVFLPRLVPHAWAHVGNTPGTIIGAVTPAGDFEAFFRKVAAHTEALSPDEADALFSAHGMQIVGPPLAIDP